MRWKTAASSVTGSSHTARGEPGQDYCRAGSIGIADAGYFIGLAADGAGSTTHGGRGAEILCEHLFLTIIETLRQDGDIAKITDETILNWITGSRNTVSAEAEGSGKRMRDYACTILAAVAGRHNAVFFQIGDGAIVIGTGEEYRTVFWPDQGEYANTTYFVTDETYRERVRIARCDTVPETVALFTDGLQNLALSFAQKKAHEGFFRPLFDALIKDPDTGFSDFSSQLRRFLLRHDISARSDDDRTLVLAVQSPG